jgi:hypothetical protein
MAEAINLKVNNGGAEAAIDAVADSLDVLGRSATDANDNLASLEKSLNAFLTTRGKAEGRTPRLFDLNADKTELEDLLKKWQEVINLQSNIRGPLNTAGQGVGNRPATPGQIAPMPGEAGEDVAKRIEYAITRLLRHHLNTNQNPANTATANTGLTYEQMTGRPAAAPDAPVAQTRRPAQNDSHFGQVAQQAINGLHSVGPAGGMAASAINGATNARDSGLGAMGIIKGGGVAALAYGAFQAVSSAGGAAMDKLDAGKTENIELDKFKRALGSTSDGFDDLKNKSRAVGEQFLLTYEQSRKLGMDFAMQARSNANGAGLTSVGVDLAQSVGIDEEQGASYLATMRRSGTLGEKTTDAKLMAVQFAEALKRTGSTLNAGDLMQALGGFSSGTAQRSLGVANVDGFAGLLSAMVGSNTPGLHGNVGNSANLLNRADAAFQGGGGMGEASNTLQFMAMEGDKIGLLGIKMRQAAGMFATGKDVFGNKDGQVNKFLGNDNMTRFGGSKSGLEQTLDMFDRQGVSKDAQLLSASNHFKMNPEEMATLFNLRKEGKLGGLGAMMSQYKGTVDPTKLSSSGLMAMADIQQAGLDSGRLGGVRDQMATREGLTKEQKSELDKAKNISDPVQLQAALVKVANTFEREKTAGEQAQKSTAEIAQSTARLVDGLIQPIQKSKDYLADLVRFLAPKSDSAKVLEEEARQGENFKLTPKISELSPEKIKDANGEFDRRARASQRYPDKDARQHQLAQIERDRSEMLGKNAVHPTAQDLAGPGKNTTNIDVANPEKVAEQDAKIDARRQEYEKKNARKRLSEEEISANKAKYSPLLSRADKEHGLPAGAMQALVQTENAEFDPSIKGGRERDKNGVMYGSSASGLTQILDGTWKGLVPAFKQKYSGREPNRDNPQDQIDMGSILLKQSLDDEKGNLKNAYAAYHGGKGWRNDPNKSLSPTAHTDYAKKAMSALPKTASMVPDVKAPIQSPKIADKAPAALPKEDQKMRQEAIARSSTSVNFNPARIDLSGMFTLNNGAETQTQQVNRSVALKPQASGVYQ